MWKADNLIEAMEIAHGEMANAEGLCYGRCVYDNYWYIGTREQLVKIGVLIINP